jgi:hypothetical protein
LAVSASSFELMFDAAHAELHELHEHLGGLQAHALGELLEVTWSSMRMTRFCAPGVVIWVRARLAAGHQLAARQGVP